VELSPAQKQQFADCCAGYTQWRAQLCERVDDLSAELEKQLCVPNPDAERVQQLADEIGEARAQELKGRIRNILLVRKTLTPSQLARLASCCGQSE
jgi:Spy/CpxP family protein refolding chaperone